MFGKVTTFIPPKCDIVTINRRHVGYGNMFEIKRNDGKQYTIIGKSYSYKKDEGLLTIRLSKGRLPIILEVEKEFLIDNTKTDD